MKEKSSACASIQGDWPGAKEEVSLQSLTTGEPLIQPVLQLFVYRLALDALYGRIFFPSSSLSVNRKVFVHEFKRAWEMGVLR